MATKKTDSKSKKPISKKSAKPKNLTKKVSKTKVKKTTSSGTKKVKVKSSPANKKPAVKKTTLKKVTNTKTKKTAPKKPTKKPVKPVKEIKENKHNEKKPLSYKVGDYLVYPHHGVGKIMKIHKMTMRKRTTSFLKLKFENSDIEMDVAEENLEKSKVRVPLSRNEMKNIFEIIGSKPNKLDLPWSKRYKDSVSKLETANIYKIAEVIRDLHHRSIINDISADERNLLIKIRKNFAAEVCVVLKIKPNKAHDKINAALNFVPEGEQIDNLMYCHVEHNSSSFDKAGGTGIHRVAKKNKDFMHGDESDEIDPYDELDHDMIESEELAEIEDDVLVEDKDDVLPEDAYDDIDDD